MKAIRRACAALLLVSGCVSAGSIGPDGIEGEIRDRFEEISAQDWQEVFSAEGTRDWRDSWFLDGLKAEYEALWQSIDDL